MPTRRATVPQIFRHLHPRDLLTLARTSKRLRAFLTRRNCAFVWRASRALVGLLDPIKSFRMSELAFANVLFNNHCHVRLTAVFVYAPLLRRAHLLVRPLRMWGG